MQLFSLIVSLTITVVIASGRCPSKSLQIGMPGKLIDSLLFHTFTLQCSLPFPPLGHPWHQENGDSFSKRSTQLECRNCKWYCTTYWSVKTWLNDFIVRLADFPQGLSMFGLRILPTLPQPRRPSYRLQAQILVAFQVYNEILPYMQKAGDTWDISPQIFFGFSAKFEAENAKSILHPSHRLR